MDKLNLVGELTALMDEAVPARDLGYCFSLSLPDHGFENCETYDEIREILEELNIPLLP
jgi:hypothetical protein